MRCKLQTAKTAAAGSFTAQHVLWSKKHGVDSRSVLTCVPDQSCNGCRCTGHDTSNHTVQPGTREQLQAAHHGTAHDCSALSDRLSACVQLAFSMPHAQHPTMLARRSLPQLLDAAAG